MSKRGGQRGRGGPSPSKTSSGSQHRHRSFQPQLQAASAPNDGEENAAIVSMENFQKNLDKQNALLRQELDAN